MDVGATSFGGRACGDGMYCSGEGGDWSDLDLKAILLARKACSGGHFE